MWKFVQTTQFKKDYRKYANNRGVAEDPGLMHRVKKEAILTLLQSGISFRVSNHSFFTRNNSWGIYTS